MYIKRHRTSRRTFAGQKDVMRLKSTTGPHCAAGGRGKNDPRASKSNVGLH
jgi:hypothetical protein